MAGLIGGGFATERTRPIDTLLARSYFSRGERTSIGHVTERSSFAGQGRYTIVPYGQHDATRRNDWEQEQEQEQETET